MRLRNRIYFGKLHLYNNKGMFILSTLIMLVGFIAVFQTLLVYCNVNDSIIQLRSVLGTHSNRLYKMESGYVSMDYDYYEKLRDVLLDLKEDYNIAIYVDDSIAPRGLPEEVETQVEQLVMENASSTDTLDGNARMGRVPVLHIDNALLDVANICTEDGSVASLQVREDGTIEVAVGSAYKGILNIGDTFTDRFEQNYIVTAFLSEDQRFISTSNGMEAVSLDLYFIRPMVLENRTTTDCIVYLDNIYLYADVGNVDNQVAAIESYASEQGVYIDMISFRDYIRQLREDNRTVYSLSVMLAVLMLITVLTVSIIFSVIVWISDSHDIGILYANGFLKRDFLLLIFQENILKLILVTLISFIYVRFFVTGGVMLAMTEKYVYRIFGMIVLIYLITMVLCSIVSYYFISRKVPIHLLKGEQI